MFLKKLHILFDFLFPICCYGCQKSGVILCNACSSRIPRASFDDFEKKQIYAVFDYRDKTIKRLLWALKYKGGRTVAHIIAEKMYDELFEELGEHEVFENFTNPLIIPIPLSKKRMRERGFNQAELIAKEFSVCSQIDIDSHVLIKTKNTPPQTSLKKAARLKNLIGCFSIQNQDSIRERNIILIDDITTTGATLREAQKTLIESGARKVIGFVIAH